MAFSLPVNLAQTPAFCQFCEVSSDIQWKCINCNLFLCRLCTSKIHSKIKSIDVHEIISLKEIGTDNAANSHRKIDFQTISCAVHDDKICCVYCRHCNLPVCSRCLTQAHQHHKYRELKEVYKEKHSEIRELYDKVELGIPTFLEEESMLQEIVSSGEREFKENKANIIQQKEYLKEIVTNHSERLLKNLEEQWWKNKYAISKKLDKTTQAKDKLFSERDHLEKTLQSHRSLDILNATIASEKCLPEIEESISVNLQHVKFIRKTLSEQDTIKKIFGSIYNVPDLQLAHTYQTNFEIVEKVIICDNNTAYIRGVKDKLQKVKFHEYDLLVEYEVNLSVYDMVPFKNGNILISSKENDLKLVSNYGKVSSFKTFSPLETLCVHANDQNSMYLGLVGPQNSTTVDVTRKIVVVDEDGNIHHSYEYDRNNQRLFTRPHRITTYKNCMVIIDLQKFGRRVILLHPGGYIVWDYIGCDYPYFEEIEFDPRDLSVSSADIILISDYNHAIHFLNLDGEVISVCDLRKEFGIEFPFCTCIDKKGTLWVSGQNLENEVAEVFGLRMK